jgi:hypothetical protein
MFGTPVTLVGLAGAVFVLASATPTSVPHGVNSSVALTRGDRLAAPTVFPHDPVASIEIWGPSEAQFILRGQDGTLLYMSDPATRTTTVVRGAEIPRIVFRPTGGADDPPRGAEPVAREPASRGGRDSHPMPVGCEGRVSPLASPEAHRIVSLCLASLEARGRS